ncbi:hypothetical protein A2U01_0095535 [Trifolium medium]|uniref:Uncharacterized protein n=1 Tax=Trifolium medium TaxID=97028 RepID=A0A392UL28_9FABA|nr:hypothetical protein [Trifolium medium]
MKIPSEVALKMFSLLHKLCVYVDLKDGSNYISPGNMA